MRGGVWYSPLSDNPFWVEATHLEPGTLPPRVFMYNHDTDQDCTIQFVAYPGPGVICAYAGWGNPTYRNARLDPEDVKNGHYPGQKGDPLNGFVNIVPGYRRIDSKETDKPLVFDIVFDPGRTLKGTLVDPEGRPVRGATAWGLSLGHTPTGTTRHGEQTLQTEEFTVTGLDREQPCTLTFMHRQRKLIGQTTVRPNDKSPLTVRLQPSGTVTGRLLDAGGKPLTGVKVYLKYPHTPDSGMRPPDQEFAVDRDGRFRVEALLPDLEHELTLEHAAKKARRPQQ